MSDNPIHHLLESVSAGQPAHRLSVDALVRTGRRRQRGVALAAAGGTAVVVAGTAGLVHQGARSSTTAGPATLGTSPVLATTAQPDPSATFAGGPPSTTSLSVISAAHVLSNGTEVGTFLRTDGCVLSPGLRVASEDAHEVVLSLGVRVTSRGVVAQPSRAAQTSCSPRLPGTSATPAGGSSVEAVARLKAPLGTRRLVDQATGRTIPYTSDTQTAYVGSLPAGWAAHDSGVRPVDVRTWEEDWARSSNDLLSLRQTFGAPDQLSGTANADVNGRPALVYQGEHGISVTWWAGGRLYELAASSPVTCAPQPVTAPVGCSPSPGSTVAGPPMSQDDLVKVARSVVAR